MSENDKKPEWHRDDEAQRGVAMLVLLLGLPLFLFIVYQTNADLPWWFSIFVLFGLGFFGIWLGRKVTESAKRTKREDSN